MVQREFLQQKSDLAMTMQDSCLFCKQLVTLPWPLTRPGLHTGLAADPGLHTWPLMVYIRTYDKVLIHECWRLDAVWTGIVRSDAHPRVLK